MRTFLRFAALLLIPSLVAAQRGGGQAPVRSPEMDFKVDLPADDPKLQTLKQQAIRLVDSMSVLTQQMVDQIFSFGELGFQEFETSKYLTGILEKSGFTVTRGVSGIPTAWVAMWRSPP